MELHHKSIDSEKAENLLKDFSEQIKTGQSKIKQSGEIPENTVVVYPGEKSFSSITEALNSITDASEQLQYQLAVGPGTFNERVTMKPYTNLLGAGQGKTIINADALNQGQPGTVIGASYSSISELTVQCNGHNWGDWVIALSLSGVAPFEAQGVTFIGNGAPNVNMRTVYLSKGGTQENIVNFGSCIVESKGNDQQPNNNAVIMFGGFMFIDLCTISATGAGASEGVSANWGGTINLLSSTISGIMYALNIDSGSSSMTAKECKINGPVSPGVNVVN